MPYNKGGRGVTIKHKAKRRAVTVKRKVVATRRKRKAVTEGESIPKPEGNLSLVRVPMLDAAKQMARRDEAARRAAELNSDEYRAAAECFETAPPVAAAR